MSGYEVPQVGDRVRVIVEGDVTNDYAPPSTDRFWLKSDDGRTSRIQAMHIVSVEKITPPLPTTVGSRIAVWDNGSETFEPWALAADGRWASLYHAGWVTESANVLRSGWRPFADEDAVEVPR